MFPPVGIAGHGDLSSQESVDLVVVGGGTAGLIGACCAADAGKTVIVCESKTDERYACATRVSGGSFHCCSTDVESPPEMLEQAIRSAVGDEARPDLVEAIAADALRSVRWLQAKGVEFVRGSPQPWHNYVLAPALTPTPALGGGGDVMLQQLEAQLVAAGGELRRGYRVERLLLEDGRCEGALGSSPDGVFGIRSRNVLIADGGFQSDLELLGELLPGPAEAAATKCAVRLRVWAPHGVRSRSGGLGPRRFLWSFASPRSDVR